MRAVSRRAARRGRSANPLVSRAAAAALLLPLLPAALRAQEPAAEPTAVLVGRVTGDSAGTGVPNVQVVASGYGIRTGPDGRFTLAVPPGTHEIVARVPGRTPWRAVRAVGAGDTLRLDVLLPPLVQTLDEVTVRRPSRAASARFAEFERRRAAAFGHFKTREELATRETSKLSDVMRGVPGVRFVFLPYGRGVALASNRFAGNMPGGRRKTEHCFMSVWVDGTRIFDAGSSESTGAGTVAADPPNINSYSVDQLEGIEVYRGPAETPPEYGGTNAMCGTVAIWTRSGR